MDDVELVKCECCGLKEDCTLDYINGVKAKFNGKWLCGLCSEAVRYELSRSSAAGNKLEDAVKAHMSFCRRYKSNPAFRVADGMRQMLRRSTSDKLLSSSSSSSSSSSPSSNLSVKKYARSASTSQGVAFERKYAFLVTCQYKYYWFWLDSPNSKLYISQHRIMADALLELAQILTSKNAQLTKEEANLLLACRSKALRDATLGSAVVGGLVWMATGKLSGFFRSNLVGGLGFLSGVWSLNKSVDSCVDHILSLDGTRMKHELARIVVRRYGNDPRKMHLISKHFFSEEVFDDSVSDQPKRMFRERSMYIDNAAQIQRSPDTYGHEDSEGNREDNNSQKKELNDIERIRKTAMESKQGFAVRGSVEQAGPLDYLLGYSDVNEDVIHPSNNSDNPTRQQTRRQRRLHRRHRLHHRHRERDSSSTIEDA